MKPTSLDLPIIWRGCTWSPVYFRWKDRDGNPFDLTGWTPWAKTRTFDLKPRILDAVNGVTTLSLNAAETNDLSLGREIWDWIWVHAATSTVTPPLLSGEVAIKEPSRSIFSPL